MTQTDSSLNMLRVACTVYGKCVAKINKSSQAQRIVLKESFSMLSRQIPTGFRHTPNALPATAVICSHLTRSAFSRRIIQSSNLRTIIFLTGRRPACHICQIKKGIKVQYCTLNVEACKVYQRNEESGKFYRQKFKWQKCSTITFMPGTFEAQMFKGYGDRHIQRHISHHQVEFLEQGIIFVENLSLLYELHEIT